MDTSNQNSRTRLAVGSLAVGATAVLASLLAFSGGAGALDAPELTESTATSVVMAEDDALEALTLEVELDPELEAAYAAYDSCIETELGVDFETADEDAWLAITDDAWVAADDACQDQLPQEIQDMNAAWKKYDECLVANGVDFGGEDAVAASVVIEDGDEFSFAEFGDADGTITITKVDGEISLATDGDVEVIDVEDFEVDETWDAAHAACEGELPEDVFFDEIMPLDDETVLDLGDDVLIAPAKG